MKRFPLAIALVLVAGLTGKTSVAQVCSSGLGDPIVDFTFGSGTDTFGPPLSSSITPMTYEKTTCPQGSDIGGYSIVHAPGNNCFGGDWVNFSSDHTGDPNGYFMLINASTPPSNFYNQEVDGLCPGTSYQFSAWIVNMASHSGEINPDITFNIEQTNGTVIQSFDTGPVPIENPAQWNQYAFYFTTPPGITSVVISMRNNAPGGYGNDLGLDDITFRTSGPSIDISIDGHAGDSVTLCADGSNNVGFTGTVGSCYASNALQWQQSDNHGSSWTDIPGAVGATYTSFPSSPGSYVYRLAAAQAGNIGNTQCRVTSDADSIVVLPTVVPAISIAIDGGHICADSTGNFTATPANPGTTPQYQWMLDGNPVSGNGSAYSSSSLVTGDQVQCQLTSNALCVSPSSARSNTVTINILADVTSSVSIVSTAQAICKDSIVLFTASPDNGGSTPSYQWQINGVPTGSDTPVYRTGTLSQGDQVSVVMKSSIECTSPMTSNVIVMTVYDHPYVQLTPDTIIAAHSHLTLEPVITGDYDRFVWEPVTYMEDPLQLDPTVAPVTTTTYLLSVSTTHCTVTAAEKVEVFYDLLMPNAFTPNGDGHNDVYRVPPSIPVTIKQFSIYNRYGRLVFSTSDVAQGWDGRTGGQEQPAGTYVWVIEYENPILKKVMMKKGPLILIR